MAEGSGTALFTTSHPALPGGAAIRLLPLDAPDAEAQERSWYLAMKLSHPGLLKILETGHGELDGEEFLYAVSEAPDDSLAGVLPKRPLEPEEIRQVLESVVPALRYLHDRGTVHGSVTPESIVAVGDTVRLSTDTLRPALELESQETVSDVDVRSLGASIVEMLTRERPTLTESPVDPLLIRRLASPFREIAAGTLQPDPERRWTLEDVERALAGLPVIPRPSAQAAQVDEIAGQEDETAYASAVSVPAGEAHSSPISRRTGALVVSGAAAALLVGMLAFRTDRGPAPAPVAEAHVAPSAAVNTPPPAINNTPATKATPPASAPAAKVPTHAPTHESAARVAEPPAAAARQQSRSGDNRWAVVAAIYKNHAAAAKRAKEIRARSKFEADVLPPEGKGSRYMVVLASGLNKTAADAALKRARAAGLPRDSYVTKLDAQP